MAILERFRRPSPLDRFRRRRSLAEMGGLPTEEAGERLGLDAEPSAATAGRRIGREILSGLFGTGSLLARAAPGTHFTPWGTHPLDIASEQYQETAGWGHPGGEARDEMIGAAVASGQEPWEAALADTAAGALGLADPTDILPAGGAAGILSRFARRAEEPIGRLLSFFGRRAVPDTSDLARSTERIGEWADSRMLEQARTDPHTAGQLRDLGVEVPAPAAREAMAHAGSASSPEAISRVAGGTKFYEVSPGGEMIPLVGVDAVDAPARRGYAKIRVSPDGQVTVESGRLSERARRAVEASRPGAAPEQAQAPRTPQQPSEEFPGASQPDLPFQSNFAERHQLGEEAATAWTEMIQRDLPAYQAQRRAGGPSNAEVASSVERLAHANGLTKEKFLATTPGTVFNREELMVLDSMVARRSEDASDLARRLTEARRSNPAEADKLQLEFAAAVYEHNALLRASVGASSELGRALQSRQEIVRAIARCFG